jgi:hypothetical protein
MTQSIVVFKKNWALYHEVQFWLFQKNLAFFKNFKNFVIKKHYKITTIFFKKSKKSPKNIKKTL